MQYSNTWENDSNGEPTLKSESARQKLVSCNSTRLAQKSDKVDYLGIKNFLCPETINLKIGGSFATEKFSEVGIAVRRCD
jgi:hypothetical protein